MILVSDILRKIARVIERDETPSEEEIHSRRRRLNELTEPSPQGAVDIREQRKGRPVDEKIDYKALPKIKRPRRKPESMKKWNKEDSPELMKQYMHDYRATGKVNETDSAKSRYIKRTVG